MSSGKKIFLPVRWRKKIKKKSFVLNHFYSELKSQSLKNSHTSVVIHNKNLLHIFFGFIWDKQQEKREEVPREIHKKKIF